jgi:DNA (cytosine-5)-methyltransferase 1
MYTHLSLFSGIGGLDLAAEMAGFTTVGQCEWADFLTKVLEKHWPDVPRWRDIRTLTGGDFYNRTGLRTVDVISGGFPCQPFSVAGKQKGKEDERFLWPEMCRVIRELKPHYVIGENVPGILRIAAADVVADLEREGYNAVVFDYEAAAVGAFHRRERIFFVGERRQDNVADTDGKGLQRRDGTKLSECADQRAAGESGALLCNTTGERLSFGTKIQMGGRTEEQKPERSNRWPTEPNVGRVAHGIPDRVDRIKSLGNAVVPQQAYPIFNAIMEVLIDENA